MSCLNAKFLCYSRVLSTCWMWLNRSEVIRPTHSLAASSHISLQHIWDDRHSRYLTHRWPHVALPHSATRHTSVHTLVLPSVSAQVLGGVPDRRDRPRACRHAHSAVALADQSLAWALLLDPHGRRKACRVQRPLSETTFSILFILYRCCRPMWTVRFVEVFGLALYCYVGV